MALPIHRFLTLRVEKDVSSEEKAKFLIWALQEVESKVRLPVEEHEIKLRNNLLFQRQQMLNCDLHLRVGSETIATHSCVMAAFSPKIATYISKEYAKSGNAIGRQGGKGKKFTIDLSLFSFDIVHAVVEAIYCGVLEVERHWAQDLLDTVEWFQTPELVSLVKDFLLEEERTEIKVFPVSCIMKAQKEKRRASAPEKSSACSLPSVSQPAKEESMTMLVTRSGRLSRATMKKANYDRTQKGSKKTLSVAVGKLVKSATQLKMKMETVSDSEPSLSENISDQGEREMDRKEGLEPTSNVPGISGSEIESLDCFSHLKALLRSPLKVKQKRKLFKPMKLQVNSPGKKNKRLELDALSSSECASDTECATRKGSHSLNDENTFCTENSGVVTTCEMAVCDKDKPHVTEAQKSVLDEVKGVDLTEGLEETEEDLWQNENTTFQTLDRSFLDPNLAPELDFLLGKVDRIRCKWCFLTFSKIDEYNNHISNHPKFKCDLCPREFNWKHHLTRHVLRVHERNVHLKCGDCQFQGGTEAQLRAHALEVHKKKPFRCPAVGCSYTCLKYSALAAHSEIHASVKKFPCEKCGQSFAQRHGLKSHRRACFALEEFLCDLCGQGFNHLQSLKNHRKTFHFGEKPYSCDICKHAFSHGANLRRHKRIHDNSFPYSCLVCKQKFRHSNSLKAHVKKHKNLPSDLEMAMTDFRDPRNKLGGRNYKKYRQNYIIDTGSAPMSPEMETEEQAVVLVSEFPHNSMPLFPTNEALSLPDPSGSCLAVDGTQSAQAENGENKGKLVKDENIEKSAENGSDGKTLSLEQSLICKEEQGMEVLSGVNTAGALVDYLPQLPLKSVQGSSESTTQGKLTFTGLGSSETSHLHRPQGEFEKNIQGAVTGAGACSIVVKPAGTEGESFSELLRGGLRENGGDAKEEAMAVEMLTPEGTSLARVIFASAKKNPGPTVGSCKPALASTTLAAAAPSTGQIVKTSVSDMRSMLAGDGQGGISSSKKLSLEDSAKKSLVLGGKTNGQAGLETLAEICFNSTVG